jgi:hypothetical protein
MRNLIPIVLLFLAGCATTPEPPQTLNIRTIVLVESQGTPVASPERVRLHFRAADAFYAPLGVRFVLDTREIDPETVSPVSDYFLTVRYVFRMENPKEVGTSSFPWRKNQRALALAHDAGVATHLHELGHWMGLEHVFRSLKEAGRTDNVMDYTTSNRITITQDQLWRASAFLHSRPRSLTWE